MARFLISLAVLLVAASAHPHHEPGHVANSSKVKVEVYYESLCPDSVKFIKDQLVPLYKDAELREHVELTLVPFGKASWVSGNNGRRTEFTCQHQAAECEGNIAQACAIKEIGRSVGTQEQQWKMVELVGCAMADSSPATAVPKCAANVGLGQESISRIEKCSNSEEGDNLLIAYGEKTYAFEKPIQSVPSVAIGGRKNPDARYQLKKIICGLIPDADEHETCRL